MSVGSSPEIKTVFTAANRDAPDLAGFCQLVQVSVDRSQTDGGILTARKQIDLIRSGMKIIADQVVSDQISLFGMLQLLHINNNNDYCFKSQDISCCFFLMFLHQLDLNWTHLSVMIGEL